MEKEQFKEKIKDWVAEGLDYDAIKVKVDAGEPEKEGRRELLEFTDERLYHKELEGQYKSKAYIQLGMGLAVDGLGAYIAYVTKDMTIAYDKLLKVIFFLIIGIGGWNIKEALKKLRQPFEPPEKFGYNRKKFQRF